MATLAGKWAQTVILPVSLLLGMGRTGHHLRNQMKVSIPEQAPQ